MLGIAEPFGLPFGQKVHLGAEETKSATALGDFSRVLRPNPVAALRPDGVIAG